MYRFKRKIAILLALLVMAGTPFAFASANTNSDTIATLTAQINALLTQIQALQQKIVAISTGDSTTASSTTTGSGTQVAGTRDVQFHSYLHRGDDNDEVRALQKYLAQDSFVYPEGLTTGYYGPMTARAVARFQKKYGIEGVGVVGPKTRAKLNELRSKHEQENHSFAYNYANKTNTSTTSTNTNTTSNNNSTTTTQEDSTVTICHNIRHNSHTITVSRNSLWAHLKQGDVEGDCTGVNDGNQYSHGDDEHENDHEHNWNNNPSDTTAPVISNLLATNVSTTTTDITWTTNENATSAVWYGTTSPVTTGNAAGTTASVTFTTAHDLPLAGLTASTTYYYFVTSTDAAGNTATSTEGSLTTNALPVVDTTAPAISGISATNSASTTMNVSWTTDKNADSAIWVATSTPVSTTNFFTTTSDATLATNHSLSVNGLTASTTYYYFVSSTDSSGNQATSTEQTYTMP